MTLTLDPDVECQLEAAAKARGLAPDDLARQVLTDWTKKTENGNGQKATDEQEKRKKSWEEFDALMDKLNAEAEAERGEPMPKYTSEEWYELTQLGYEERELEQLYSSEEVAKIIAERWEKRKLEKS